MTSPLATEPRPSRFHWRDLGLGTRLGLASAVATAVVVGLAFVGLRIESRHRTRQLFVAELERNERTIAALQTERLQDLLWTASLASQSPTLRAAMETYRDEPAAGRGLHKEELLTTVQRAVEKSLASLDHDLLIVLGHDGRVIGAAARGTTAPPTGFDLSGLPAVKAAIDPNAMASSEANALLDFHGEHFQVGCTPIELAGYPIGAVLLGDRLAGSFVQRLTAAFDGYVIVATPKAILASTYRGPLAATDLPRPRTTRGAAGDTDEDGTFHLRGEELAFATLPLGQDANGNQVAVYLLDSVTQAMSPMEAMTGRQFALYGILAVVLVGLLTGFVTRAFLGPLGRFVEFMRRVASSRDYSMRFDATPAGPEIKTLNGSYDSLIESLESKHGELVKRSTELGLANEALWQQMQERERIQHALEESEKQLRQSQKLEAVGTLAGGVAHDFNNLLTVIIGHSQMMFETMSEENPLQKDLTQIRAAADRAAALTRQLLAFSRKQLLKPKTLDLVVVVQGMRTLLRRLIGEDIDLKIWLPSAPAWVLADPTQIEQVLLNLAVNARDAMPRGGVLTIEVALIPAVDPSAPTFVEGGLGTVQLAVRDTGTGMDAITKERIFEPFFTTKGPGSGTGLGLSTVYGIVEQSGGEISVESSPGMGARFQVRLPEAMPAVESEIEEAGDTAPASHGHETILLVEDEPDVRRLAARALTAHGYVILEATAGIEALEIARRYRGPIDLLLTDVVMPGLNGKELLVRLAETRPETRPLFMSGYPADIIANRGLLDPRTGFIQKPFTPSVLLQRVRLALDAQREAGHVAA